MSALSIENSEYKNFMTTNNIIEINVYDYWRPYDFSLSDSGY